MIPRRRTLRKVGYALASFLSTEAAGGVVLFVFALVALLWANTLPSYESVWHSRLRVGPASMDLRHWVNDGLMSIFFLVVGLEIKRELVLGELRDARVAAMPVIAAVGGMAGPAAVY